MLILTLIPKMGIRPQDKFLFAESKSEIQCFSICGYLSAGVRRIGSTNAHWYEEEVMNVT
jgi:hypothetical protein